MIEAYSVEESDDMDGEIDTLIGLFDTRVGAGVDSIYPVVTEVSWQLAEARKQDQGIQVVY